MNRNGTNFKQFNEGKMDYLVFDTLGSKKSQNKILTILKGEPQTFDELAKKTDLNRTSVFYHISQLQKEGKVDKKFVGKLAYIGLKKEYRGE